jgi:ribosomal-protein-alanine N-acetyltransferase
MGMRLRALTPDDLETLAALHKRAFDRPWSAAEIAALAGQPASFGLVAESVEGCAGFCIVWAAADESEVLTIAAAPECRRRGVGSALIRAAMAAARERGAAAMMLEVAVSNAPARALYGGLGFAEIARRPGYYTAQNGPPIDALVLKRGLLDT